MTRTEPDGVSEALLDLLRIAISAKVAAEIGLPRLAVECARATRDAADRAVIELSPAVAAMPAETERQTRGTLSAGDLTGLLASAYPNLSDDVEETS